MPPKDEANRPAATVPQPKPKKKPEADATRETVESVVVAFILAFLFRTFEAEAFVIPTGSMAPTLYGQHRDVFCKQCGVRFASGASDEFGPQATFEEDRTHTSYCPNCRYPNFVYKDEPFTGDRILVSKFPYDYRDPEPWDVVVFKWPEGPKINYIKRMVGLPGQEIRLEDGDVLVRPAGSSKPWQILRKAPDKQFDLQMVVYDDDHVSRELLASGWPERWQPEQGAQWTRPKDGQRSVRVDAAPTTPTDWHWLRYHHAVPDSQAWEAVRAKKKIVNLPVPLLITDFCGYNARVTVRQARIANGKGPFPEEKDPYPPLVGGTPWFDGHADNANGVLWVGDLTVHSEVEVLSNAGDLMWELIEGPRSYRARLDVAKGNVTFSYLLHDSDGSPPEEITLGAQAVATPIQGPGTYQVAFANVDDRLCFWVNEQLVKSFEFNPEAQDGRLTAERPVRPTARDLSPVGIAARGCSAIVRHLKLERDVYYREGSEDPTGKVDTQVVEEPGLIPNIKNFLAYRTSEELAALQGDQPLTNAQKAELAIRVTLSDPEKWNAQFSTYLRNIDRKFVLKDSEDDMEDEFMVLGDNSPRSSDSRFWNAVAGGEHAHAVPRKLMIGKAFFIYWPHAVPFLNNGKGYAVRHWPEPDGDHLPPNVVRPKDKIPALSLPWYPQFGRMSRIR